MGTRGIVHGDLTFQTRRGGNSFARPRSFSSYARLPSYRNVAQNALGGFLAASRPETGKSLARSLGGPSWAVLGPFPASVVETPLPDEFATSVKGQGQVGAVPVQHASLHHCIITTVPWGVHLCIIDAMLQ
jgi:hypothetical protein